MQFCRNLITVLYMPSIVDKSFELNMTFSLTKMHWILQYALWYAFNSNLLNILDQRVGLYVEKN